MKKLVKILLLIFIILSFCISILYGTRILNTPYIYEYLNNSLVVTIPNKLWFEINSQNDYLSKGENTKYLFENDLVNFTKSGYSIGYIYPTYTAKTENDTTSKTDTVTRQKDSLKIQRTIQTQNSGLYDNYISKIIFSKYGTFLNNTYTQDGCDIAISSTKGEIEYDEKSASVLISYKLNEVGEIKDILDITIQCKGL